STLDQPAVRIEQQLSVVERSTIALVDANRHHHARLPARLADCNRRWRRHCHRLLEQHEVLPNCLKWTLHEGEVGIVGQNGFWKGCELHAVMTKLDDLLDDFFRRSLATIEYGTDLHGGCLDSSHGCIL